MAPPLGFGGSAYRIRWLSNAGIIKAVRNAISKLNAEERDIIERLYFNDETLSSVARDKGVTYQTIQWRKDRILRKLKEILEKLL